MPPKSQKKIPRRKKQEAELGIVPDKLPVIVEENDKDDGEGLDNLKRKAGLLPPPVRKLLSEIGNTEITSIKITRTPLSSAIKTLLNVISLGAYNKAVKNSPYDEMFHLAIFVNGTYTIDKQAVIKFVKTNPIRKSTETFDLPLQKKVTYNELFENGRQKMGDDKFTNYDARLNNCQDFILGLLDGSGLLTSDARAFIKQDADAVWRRMPSISEKIGLFLTDVGAVADRVVEGEGVLEQWVQIGKNHYHFPVIRGGEIPEDVKKLAEARYKLKKATEEFERALPEREKPQLLPVYNTTTENLINKKQSIVTTPEQVDYAKGQFIARRSGGSDTQWTVWNGLRLVRAGLLKHVAIEMVNDLYERSGSDKKINKKTSSSNKHTSMESWREFWSKACKGKKFGSRQAVNSYMKEMAAKYRAMKNKK